jgi:tetraacyldisaccharide-1-P 4'-kinase
MFPDHITFHFIQLRYVRTYMSKFMNILLTTTKKAYNVKLKIT